MSAEVYCVFICERKGRRRLRALVEVAADRGLSRCCETSNTRKAIRTGEDLVKGMSLGYDERFGRRYSLRIQHNL